jgi:PleD family two-component response regulator
MDPTQPRHRRPPLVLIINDQEWSTRSLESFLAPNGYAVLRAYTGSKGLERAQAARPDIIVVGVALPDTDGLDLCRQLREDPRITPSTPIIITTTGRPTRNERLAALRAGAWDFVGQPLDAEELLLRFECFVRAKHDADRVRDEGLVDPLTGLYSVNGLSRRAHELGAQAYRQSASFACVVFRAEGPEHEPAVEAAVQAFAERLRSLGRTSDGIGRIGGADFAVFAAGTGQEGAEALIARLVDQAESQNLTGRISSGYYAVKNFREANLQPQDLLTRASDAMRRNATKGRLIVT